MSPFQRLCASRSGEVLGARWSEINIGQKTWTIPAARMKADKDHTVPLAPAAIEILAGQSHDSEFVFAAPRSGRAMERHALADVMKAMGRRETVHGFHSSFSDWAADNTAFPQEVREQALAHAIPNKVEAAYRRGALLEKRRRCRARWLRCPRASSRPKSVNRPMSIA